MILLLLLIALAPCLFLLWYFYHRDRYEPEPKKKILKIFFIGALMVLPAALIEYVLITGLQYVANGIVSIFIMSFIIIAPVEELVKYLTVRRWIYRSIEFNEVMDGIVYTVAASLGFATVENILYVLQHGIAVGIARAFLAVPGHAFFGAIMGFYIGRAKFKIEHESRYLWTGVLLAIFFHGLYDFLALTQTALALLVIVVIAVLGIWVFRNLKSAERQSKVRVVEESISVSTGPTDDGPTVNPEKKIPRQDE
ncbi:MAG: PrsW family intramembrane metalloprotease [candidate division WOR-3 bacterium]|nr:MAG: PrsW family intramembrane metalloprotease [candidate division WOR-3 bacterium]